MFMIPWFAIRSFQLYLGWTPKPAEEGITQSSDLKEDEVLASSGRELLTSSSHEALMSSRQVSQTRPTAECLQNELPPEDGNLKQVGSITQQVAPNSEPRNKLHKQQENKDVFQEVEAPLLQQQVQQLQEFQARSEQQPKQPGQKQQVKAPTQGLPSPSPQPQLRPASQPDSNSSSLEPQVVNSTAARAENVPPVSTWHPQVELTHTPVLAQTATQQVELGHTPVSAQTATQQHSVPSPKKSSVSAIPQLVKAPPPTKSPPSGPTQTSSRTSLTNSAAGKMSFEWAQKQVEQFKFDFDQADKDRSGALSFQEVYEVLQNVGFKGTQEEAKLIFGHLDRDNDQKVTKQEFEAALKKLPRLSIKEFVLRKAFLQLDKDKSGYLSRSEIEDATKSQEGLDIAASKIADLLIYLCKEDEDGKVSYEEFLRVFGIESAATVMQQVFSKLDTDGSGYLTKEEILEAVKAESELKLKADKIADLLIYWCKDQDKKISYQEFVQVWLQQRESRPAK